MSSLLVIGVITECPQLPVIVMDTSGCCASVPPTRTFYSFIEMLMMVTAHPPVSMAANCLPLLGSY